MLARNGLILLLKEAGKWARWEGNRVDRINYWLADLSAFGCILPAETGQSPVRIPQRLLQLLLKFLRVDWSARVARQLLTLLHEIHEILIDRAFKSLEEGFVDIWSPPQHVLRLLREDGVFDARHSRPRRRRCLGYRWHEGQTAIFGARGRKFEQGLHIGPHGLHFGPK